jgi:phage shock protein E
MFNLFNKKFKAITPQEAKQVLTSEKGVFLIDVRNTEEYRGGHIKGSVSIPLHILEATAIDRVPNKDAKILVYCLSGGRSQRAAGILADMGYSNVYNLGGICNWPYEITK